VTELRRKDLAVVTGPLRMAGYPAVDCALAPGEVVELVDEIEEDGNVLVYGHESDRTQYIDSGSLTPILEIQDDESVEWGAEDEQYVRLCSTHDYVYAEDDE
jgi:hypothetical protein